MIFNLPKLAAQFWRTGRKIAMGKVRRQKESFYRYWIPSPVILALFHVHPHLLISALPDCSAAFLPASPCLLACLNSTLTWIVGSQIPIKKASQVKVRQARSVYRDRLKSFS